MAEKLEEYISKLEKLTALKDKNKKGSIRWYIQWYEDRYPSRRNLYRFSGIIILLIALFAVSQSQGMSLTNPSFLVTVSAFIVGLTVFFSWGAAWRGYFQAKVRLEFLMDGWKATLLEAREIQEEEKAIELVSTRFSELLKESSEAILEETKSFFDSIKFPSIDTKIK